MCLALASLSPFRTAEARVCGVVPKGSLSLRKAFTSSVIRDGFDYARNPGTEN